MKKHLTLLFIGVAMGVWFFQMIPSFLLEFLPRQFYIEVWGVILVVFVIWPFIYDFIEEEDHEID